MNIILRIALFICGCLLFIPAAILAGIGSITGLEVLGIPYIAALYLIVGGDME